MSWRDSPFAGAQIDFSQLAKLPDNYAAGREWRQEQDKGKALRELMGADGAFDYGKATHVADRG